MLSCFPVFASGSVRTVFLLLALLFTMSMARIQGYLASSSQMVLVVLSSNIFPPFPTNSARSSRIIFRISFSYLRSAKPRSKQLKQKKRDSNFCEYIAHRKKKVFLFSLNVLHSRHWHESIILSERPMLNFFYGSSRMILDGRIGELAFITFETSRIRIKSSFLLRIATSYERMESGCVWEEMSAGW
jgi:hypothetical protein